MRRHDLEFISIPRMVLASAERFGDAESIVDVDAQVRWTFTEVAQRMIESVRAAIAFGVGPGDRVAIWAPNSADWIVAALGVLGAGGILVPLNTRFKGAEAAYILRKTDAKGVLMVSGFAGNDYISMLQAERVEVPIVLIGSGSDEHAVTWSDYIAGAAAVNEAEARARIAAVGPNNLSDIMFTSGTTGAPKGVMLTHGQSLRAFGYLADVLTFRPGDRYLVIPPFFHTFGYKCGWMACMLNGVCAIPKAMFDADSVLRILSDERVSILLGPPTLFADLIRHPRRQEFDLSRMRVAACGAANVPPPLYAQVRDELGVSVVLSAYGLTEATSLATNSAPGDAMEDIADSVGRPARDIEIKLVDEVGTEVPAGEPGEVLVRGYNVMRGYWGDPAATSEVIDVDGWLHTGDIGIMNARGFLKIVDRKKDMYIVGGFNVYPAEVERVMGQHAEVSDVAVIGVPDERMGEVGAAFVVGKNLTEQALISWARERMANFKVPRYVHFVDELPRNSSMKVIKPRLRELWRARSD
ncbi:AMP-binding protein [Mycolicibacterium pyrenivorans]|uniref:AMP-binding protein n=1 Tax=Mycolicibacterium pyrenivorans TaxID=187102 RepID=UPI0021F3271C|nr:AMP-binding protein [Mycolicibacterium pyrenivorans]MCV7151258.1 AMP-binding protein [Mycolicibacterium pyrenivorans]